MPKRGFLVLRRPIIGTGNFNASGAFRLLLLAQEVAVVRYLFLNLGGHGFHGMEDSLHARGLF